MHLAGQGGLSRLYRRSRAWQGQDNFQVQPRRWVVERTFAWLMRYRRLVRNYEQRFDVSQAMISITLGSSLLHRMRFR